MRNALTGFITLVLLVSGTDRAFAQLEGRLYLDKDRYVAGEPVYLNFELRNNGQEPLQFASGDSYSFCGGFQIEVSSDPPPANSSCAFGFAGSCIGGTWVLASEATRKDRVLLNYEHDLSKPGVYIINASRTLKYGPPERGWPRMTTGEQLKVEARVQIRLEYGNDETLVPLFRPFITDLTSKEEQQQREAARVIGSLAPPFLEDTIISMMDSPATRPFALMGLRRLNTPRSREALASLVQETSGYSYQKEQAIKYLSEMGDKKYFPLLLDEAKKHQPDQARDYVLAAATLGGEDAMPYVVYLLYDPSPFSHANAVMALPQTGSRSAVALLIDMLRSEDVDLARLASIGLIQLTHRSPFKDGRQFSDSPSRDYADWIRWWALNGNIAPLYGPSQCGAVELLK